MGENRGIQMKEIVIDEEMVAYCGLYCGACRSYLNGKCPGCHENLKATWCTVKSCCRSNKYSTCADCAEFRDTKKCKKMNNFISKVMSVVFRSNRHACIARIRKVGISKYAKEMTAKKKQTLPR